MTLRIAARRQRLLLRQVRTAATGVKAIEQAVQQTMNETVKPLDHWNQYSNVLLNKPDKPMVLLLGNHSAGKSTLVNTLLGTKIQATGVAPTDDGFTLIMRGEKDAEEDGPTVVGTPSHGLQELATFGSSFVNLLKMKMRKVPESSHCPKDLILVDSPGMIGSPGDAGNSFDRDYDLLKVTRWFAERADVILLMFDPANPGTTGETLDVLTQSLADLEHKFLIVMNKVDQFDNVSDFARAYGALCWNLSKVVRRKDIPRIYTVFTPGASEAPGREQRARDNALPIQEFEKMRREVMEQVLRAPARQVDNLLTLLDQTTRQVDVSSRILERMRSRYRSAAWRSYATVGLLAAAGVSISSAFRSIAGAAATLCVGAAGLLCATSRLESYERKVAASLDEVLLEVIKDAEERELNGKYRTIRKKLALSLQKKRLWEVSAVSTEQLNALRKLMEHELPAIREKACAVRYQP